MMLTICHINLAKGFRGGERQTELLIKALCEHDSIYQKVIVRKDSPLLEKITFRKNKLHLYRATKPYVRHTSRIKGSSLVHVHEAKGGQLAFLAHRIYGIPYLITRRVPNPIKSNPLTSRIYSSADRIVALSSAIRKVLVSYDSNLKPIIIPSMVSNLSVDPRSRNRIRKRYKNKFLVGHAGALVNRHKGQQYILEAAAHLQDEFPQVHFLLLGEGPDERTLTRAAKGLKNLELLGFRDNVGDFLAAFDAFAFPSLREGLGSVLLDAMQFRLPIVASNVDGIPDIIEHGKNGLLIPPQDGKALAEAIAYMYRNQHMCKKLSRNAFKTSQHYHPSVIVKKYLRLYQEICFEPYAGSSILAT